MIDYATTLQTVHGPDRYSRNPFPRGSRPAARNAHDTSSSTAAIRPVPMRVERTSLGTFAVGHSASGDITPETKYARSGDVNIAYQVVGDGPIDIVLTMAWVTHLDHCWEEPRFTRFVERLTTFGRVILFDKRGTGLSDRVTASNLPTMKERLDDLRAVMDAAASERAVLVGVSDCAALSALFAATYPERTAGLIIYGGVAKRTWAPDYPWAPTREERERFHTYLESEWGRAIELDILAPSVAEDESFRRWWAAYLRRSASPGAVVALAQMSAKVDIRHVLPKITVPTLILRRTGDRMVKPEESQYMLERIPEAQFVELPGDDHLPFVGDQDALLDEIEYFVTGTRPTPRTDRVLATVMVTELHDVVETAMRLGDRRWSDVSAAYHALVQDELARSRGRAITPTLEGVVAIFDGPARAVRCAQAIVTGAQRLGIKARAGLHTGEVDVIGAEIGGVAVHFAARVAAHAPAGEVFASSTVRDLIVGSGLELEATGTQSFAGLPGEWQLFRLTQGRPAGQSAPSVKSGAVADGGARVTSQLSRREREVAALLALGLSNRQLADELFITVATVERHVANILMKLGFRSRAQVAAWAVEHGLLRAGPVRSQS